MKIKQTIFSLFQKIVRIFSGYGFGKKITFLRSASDLLFFHLKPDFIEVDGNKIFLDSKDSLRLSWGDYEPLETEIFKNEIRKGDTVVDLGANIGYYTLIAAKAVGEKGKAFAFEPDPDNFVLLEKNIASNGYKNVTLVKKAVSNKTGIGRLYLNDLNYGDHRIYDSGDGRQFIEIKATSLDDYFHDYGGRVDLIKMDIQGAEEGAFRGMLNLLKRNKNIKIISEFWPFGLKKSGIRAEDYLELIIKHGFKLHQIDEEKKRMVPITPIELIRASTDDFVANLLLKK